MKIYRNEQIIYDLPVDGSATYLRKMMGEHSVKCNVTVEQPLALQVGDYIMEGTTAFTLYDDAGFTHTAGTYAYSLAFYAPYYGLNYTYYRNNGTTKFDYHGGVREHLQAWLSSARGAGTAFVLGTVEENGTQLINFDKAYCLSALTMICEAFGMEYEINNKTVHVRKRVGADMPYVFEYGRDKGLYSLERLGVENRSVVTKLTGKGAASNLPVDYRHTETPVPDTLVFGKRFLTMNTAKYGIREEEKVFDDIYPRLKDKKVLSVQAPSNIETAKTWTLQLDIPFDLNTQLAPGKDAQVHFTSGELQGESFSVADKSFNPATKELRIIVSEKDGYALPRASRQPHIGDGFVLLDILMPAVPYLSEAEAELEERTSEELKKICVRQYAHKLSVQPRYVRRNNIRLEVGDKVTVKDKAEGMESLIRVMEISYPVLEPYQISVLLSDEILYSYDEKIRNDINDVTADVVDAYRQIQNTSRRAWKDARELSDMVKGLEAELLLVGNPEGQFTSTSLFKANKNNDPNHFTASAGTLQHKVYTDNPPKVVWRLEACDLRLEDSVAYFLYARCAKTTPVALFVASKEAKEVEDEDYYYFRVGLISSVFENARVLKTTSGFTQIAGGDITTEKIQDASQRLVIDLVNAVITARNGAEIRGKISFQSGGGGFQDVGDVFDGQAADIQDAQQAAADAGRTVENIQHYLDNDFQAVLEGIQSQVDGLVESHFGTADPTLLNNPAVLWTTESERQKHANDTYTHTTSLQSWKWVKENNVWQWKLLPANDLSKALADSARAQATADAKRRNFGVTPYPPYDVDDLWITTSGEIMSCVIPNRSGAFNATHWTKKVKYTDDSAVDNIRVGNVNLLNNSKSFKVGFAGSGITSKMNSDGTITITAAAGNENVFTNFLPSMSTDNLGLQEGEDYCVVCWVKTDAASRFSVFINYANSYTTLNGVISNTEYKPWYVVRKYAAGTSPLIHLGFITLVGSWTIQSMMICKGNVPPASWSPSPADVQAEIAAAEKAANEAKARLAAMSNDGVISKEEKVTLRNDKAQIDKEFAKYQQDATTYGVSAAALQTAYNALVNFLAVTVKIADTTDYTFAAGGKDAYNKCFADYYSARSAFANLIAAKVAATAVDGIQIGGTNLLDNSDFTKVDAKHYTTKSPSDIGVSAYTLSWENGMLKASSTTGGDGNQDKRFLFVSGTMLIDNEYILSFDVKSDKVLPLHARCFYNNEVATCQVSTTLQRVCLRIKKESAATDTICLYSVTPGTIYIDNVKLEAGNKPTAWSPSPGDVQTEIAAAEKAANEAKARLAAMSNDGVISKEEKVTLRNDKAQIDKEFAKYQQDATTYGVSAAALQTAYNALVNFLAVTVKIADTTDYTFATGGKDAYNKCFADYYSARSAFANLIAAKVANGVVEGLQIGGRNYALDTTRERSGKYWGIDPYILSPDIIDKEVMIIITFNHKNTESVTGGGVGWGSPTAWSNTFFWFPDNSNGQKTYAILKPAGVEAIWYYLNSSSTVFDFSVQVGNKTTGWTPAPEDIQFEVDKAQAVADEAKARLAAMSNDGVISKEEKTTLRNDKAQIDKEFAKYQQDATTYGVSAAALQTAYNALANFLAGTVKIADAVDYTFAAGGKDAYNKCFADYYSARSAFANLIAAKVAATAVDNVRVGSVNLLNNSKSFKVGFAGSGITSKMNSDGTITITAAAGNGNVFTNFLPAMSTDNLGLQEGEDYCVVCWVKTDAASRFSVFINYANSYTTLNGVMSNTEYKPWYLVRKYIAGGQPNIHLGFSNLVGSWTIQSMMICKGNIPPASWSPSPGDVQTEIAAAEKAANAANAAIADMSSDNVISPSEKPALKKEWDIIVSEKPMNTSQAASFGVSSAAYTTAYNNLSSLIGTNLNTLTTNWNVSGVTLRATFKAYYDARTALLNAIAMSVKLSTDAKPMTFTQTTMPVAARKDDTWYCGIAESALSTYVCLATYTGNGSMANWLLVSDNTETTINSGLITTGTIYLRGGASVDKLQVRAGISGSGGTNNSVRFWAGGTLAQANALVNNPNATSGVACTVITQDGHIYANKLVAVNADISGVFSASYTQDNKELEFVVNKEFRGIRLKGDHNTKFLQIHTNVNDKIFTSAIDLYADSGDYCSVSGARGIEHMWNGQIIFSTWSSDSIKVGRNLTAYEGIHIFNQKERTSWLSFTDLPFKNNQQTAISGRVVWDDIEGRKVLMLI